VIVAISRRLRRAETEAILVWGLLLGAVSVGVGYVVVATIRTDTIAIWDYGSGASFTNLARLLVICLALFASFVAVGGMIGRPVRADRTPGFRRSRGGRARVRGGGVPRRLGRPAGDDHARRARPRPGRSPPRRPRPRPCPPVRCRRSGRRVGDGRRATLATP